MPDGLQYAISSKLSKFPRVSIVGYETGPSLYAQVYVQETLTNFLDDVEGSGSNLHLHLLLFAHNLNNFRKMPNEKVTVYDFVRNPYVKLEDLFERLMKDIASKPERSHVLILDDYSLFSILSSGKDISLQTRFLRLIAKQFRKVVIFFHKDTLDSAEVGVMYDVASDIALLQAVRDVNSGNCNSSTRFVCDLLKIRNDRRAVHEKTAFQVCNDEIKEEGISESSERNGSNEADLLKNLTTFKLTLEEDEKETRSKLHLPYFDIDGVGIFVTSEPIKKRITYPCSTCRKTYFHINQIAIWDFHFPCSPFNAQTMAVENPQSYDDYDDDEEDEEI